MRWLSKFFPGCCSKDLSFSVDDLVAEMESLKIQLKILESSVKDLEKIVAERSNFFDLKIAETEKVVETLSQDLHKYKPILSPPKNLVIAKAKTAEAKEAKVLKRVNS